ncbi:tetratricopeptide repeat protein [Trinickia fusca]|uniref:Tetratricopeptide repeat protein n=2 Tax=Trinickia fusca TaxID=2419777 RepID=A0A494X596_9BURK|nr:tetratricopeptide repeat protein [Trinickia fusca]
MFKRILSTLSGKKDDTTTTASSSPTRATESQPLNGELITVYDAYGREMKITRAEWRDKVFLPNLQQKWNNAAELYNLIVSGLNDGFAADLMPAAARLVEIDDIPERSHTIQGIVQMKNGQLDAAEATLRTGMAKAGETGTLLTNLAKVFAERGDQIRADETLWQAVQTDPNQDNGLLWWAAIQRERRGEAAYLQALRTAAALPRSWRAKLWLARHHLEHKEIEAARALYAEVLAAGVFDGSSLMMMSGDLGNNDQVPLILELVGPAYDEHKHDPMTGLNLLRACQQLGKADEGEALLARMYPLGFSPIKHHLDQFAQAFQEMRKQAAQGTPIDPHGLKIATLTLSQPIWHYGLRNANWLFTQKPEGAQEVGFFALSKIMDGSERAGSQREDDLGRLTRAIPLYLAEAAHYWSDYVAHCYVQIVEGAGPVVSGCEADGNALFDVVPPRMKYFVTGEIACSGESDHVQWQVSLSLWDCATRTKQASESGKAVQAELGALVVTLEKRLLARIGLKREHPLDAFYQHPAADIMPAYLAELGQAFMLTLLANEHMSKSALWGERTMLDWPLTMALHWPAAEVPKLMYISGLGKAQDYRSDILAEYKERSLQLLREAGRANSPVGRLAPIVWKAFSMEDELQAHIRNLPSDTNPAYKAWLERVGE